MFDTLRRQFARFAGKPVKSRLEPTLGVEPVLATPSSVFTEEATKLLDANNMDCFDVIDNVERMKGRLHLVDPMVNARMMGVLSAEIDRIYASGEADDRENKRFLEQLTQTGQTIAVSTQVPEHIVKLFNKVVDKLAVDIESTMQANEHRYESRLDPNTPLDGKELLEMIAYINNEMAKRCDIKRGINTVVVNEPKSNRLGQARWNDRSKNVELEVNVKDVKTVRDFAPLSVILVHEAVHGALAQAEKSAGDLEKYRTINGDFYMLMRICDRNFYTSDNKDVYRKHPEEVLAHRVGMRFGLQLSKALNSKHSRADFLGLADAIPHASVYGELDRVFPPSESPLPTSPTRRDIPARLVVS